MMAYGLLALKSGEKRFKFEIEDFLGTPVVAKAV